MTEPSEISSRLLKDLNEARSKHLTYAQLEDFVDSRLESTENEFVHAHIELCSQCNRELEDLQWFSESRRYRQEVAAAAARPGFWEGIGQWFKVPRHRLAMTGAAMAMAALIAVLARIHTPSSDQPSIATTPAASSPATGSTAVAPPPEVAEVHPKPEAVLQAPSNAQGAVGSRQMKSGSRVLSEAEVYAYRDELAQANNDPEARAAIAIKYGLYGEAEKEYLKMEAAGGKQAQKAHLLLERLKQLRALAEK